MRNIVDIKYVILRRTVYFLTILSLIIVNQIALSAFAWGQIANQKDVPAPQKIGAWTKVCSLPPGTPNIQCELVQTSRAQNRPDINFQATIHKLPSNEGVLMRVFVPIRVELRSGIYITIDNKAIGRMDYSRCLGESCAADAFLKDSDFKAFTQGQTAIFTIFTTPEEGINGSISLDGLQKAYATLPKQ